MNEISFKPDKQSPLFEVCQESGAQFMNLAGWQIPGHFGTMAEEIEGSTNRVVLLDDSAIAKVRLEGFPAAALLERAWSIPQLEIGRGALSSDRQVYRLRQDLFFILDAPGREGDLMNALGSASHADELITISNMTDGRAALRLIGPRAAELLSRLCGLDIHPDRFPNLAARQSSVAKTGQLVVRFDVGRLPAYYLIGDRSLAAYLWRIIIEAGHDLGISPIGQAALQQLSEKGP